MKTLLNMLVAAAVALACAVPAMAHDDDGRMFMVNRYHVENVRDLLTDELDRAHQDHIKKYSTSVTSANILDENGKTIGVTAIKGFSSLEEVEFYVYEDPFTKANFYKKIEIIPINLYVLNAEFARVPDWVLERDPQDAWKYTPATPDGCACETAAGD